MLNAAKAYLSTQVSTASQGDVLVMLYDTAIKHLRQSIEKMRAGDMAGKGILITKTLTIIGELLSSLDRERGGEIANNLTQLYFFCNKRLLMANLKVKPEMVEEVITILFGLRQAFAQILPQNQGVASVTQPGANGSSAAVQPEVQPAAAHAAAPSVPSAPAASTATRRTVAVDDSFVAAGLTLGAPAFASKPASKPEPAPAPEPQPATRPALNPLVAPPVQPAAQPEAEPSRTGGLRLRAVNAYSTTR